MKPDSVTFEGVTVRAEVDGKPVTPEIEVDGFVVNGKAFDMPATPLAISAPTTPDIKVGGMKWYQRVPIIGPRLLRREVDRQEEAERDAAMQPPLHPMCRCVLVPLTSEELDRIPRLGFLGRFRRWVTKPIRVWRP